MDAVVLETYGSGTFSTNEAMLVEIRNAVARGVVIVNCSQCHSGRVEQDRYLTSRSLANCGVVSGGDMTPEAALTKLYCLLAAGYPAHDVARRVAENIAGEITVE
jgi:L-asparaginase